MGTQQPEYNLSEIWKIAHEQFQIRLSPQNYASWFKNTSLQSIENGIATVGCQSTYNRDWIEMHHGPLVKNILNQITKSELSVVFTVTKSVDTQDSAPDSEEGSKSASSPDSASNSTPTEITPENRYQNMALSPEEAPIFNIGYTHQNLFEDAQKKANLNPEYNFEKFVVGDSNRLAHAAAEAVAQNPGRSYNPLFLYGGVGLGKTHIMQAIGNRILSNEPNKKIFYCSSEQFLNQMVEAIRGDKNVEFRNNFRKLDVLMIDDIQFISEWERAQQELFHTYNTLFQSGKQIILASDRRPEEIEKLEDRLRSRFQGGMVADISKPNLELRMAIVKLKAEERGIILPPYVLDLIAKYIEDNIRELEGALTKIGTYVKIGGVVPSEEEVAKILEVDAESKRKKYSPKDIVRSVCKEFGISVKDIRGRRRTAEIVEPRQVCMYLLRKELDLPLERVARELNRSDHTTVLHAIERVEEKMEIDEGFKERVEGWG